MNTVDTSLLHKRIGAYDVCAKLGGGGMGEVFLARQTGPADFVRPVVLKVIRDDLVDDERYRRMFLDEARITATIAHPNVVHAVDFGEHDDTLFMAMEYLEGESLSSILRHQGRRDRRMSPTLIAHIMAEVCAGLQAAHTVKTVDGEYLHLVHRDITPSNIFVTYGGSIKLLDFGIARAEERLVVSRSGHFGKMGYMSPEQLVDKLVVDRRSDIFSLGIVLFELCTTRRLFRRKTQRETALAILKDPIPLPSDVAGSIPLQLDLICQRCLARRPEDRYQSAVELRRDLLDLRQGLALPGTAPEEEVATFLNEMFAERKAQKARMLSELNQLPLGAPLRVRPHTPSLSSARMSAEASARAFERGPATYDSWFSRTIGSVADARRRRSLFLALAGLIVALVTTWQLALLWRPVPVVVAPEPTGQTPVAPSKRVGATTREPLNEATVSAVSERPSPPPRASKPQSPGPTMPAAGPTPNASVAEAKATSSNAAVPAASASKAMRTSVVSTARVRKKSKIRKRRRRSRIKKAVPPAQPQSRPARYRRFK